MRFMIIFLLIASISVAGEKVIPKALPNVVSREFIELFKHPDRRNIKFQNNVKIDSMRKAQVAFEKYYDLLVKKGKFRRTGLTQVRLTDNEYYYTVVKGEGWLILVKKNETFVFDGGYRP